MAGLDVLAEKVERLVGGGEEQYEGGGGDGEG